MIGPEPREDVEVALTEEERAEILRAGFSTHDHLLQRDTTLAAVERILAERVRAAAVEALRDAADEIEAVIADGDVAEVAAPVSGEVGRSRAVAKRDALYEEPHTWLRDHADRKAER